MPYPATVFNIMIASPSDVNVERAIVRDVIHEWNGIHCASTNVILMPLGWETDIAPMTGDRAQSLINAHILERSDLLVAMFWTRIGTPTGDAVSGTAEEIRNHIEAGKPAMIYFSDTPVRMESVDDRQYSALREFKSWCCDQGLIETYDDHQAFREKFRRQLGWMVNNHTLFKAANGTAPPTAAETGIPVADQPAIPALSTEARHLLLESATSKDGIISRIYFMGGAMIGTGGKNYVEPNNPRSLAAWEGAIHELEALGFVDSLNDKGSMLRINKRGYETADVLAAKP